MLFSFFFSGHMFPLDMLPGVLGTVIKLTPFPYLAYFPATVFLGKIQGAALIIGLCVQLFWVLLFIAVSRLTFFYGTKRYSGYGG
jgi:ABC-2 type transport system permease protein